MGQHAVPDVIGVGMCTADVVFSVPELPSFGKKVRAAGYLRQPGGMAATALVTLARLGVSTRFFGKVGDDPEGLYIRDEFVREGVDVGGLAVEPGALSLVALVLVDAKTGERCFTGRPGTFAPLGPGDLDREAIAGAKVLLVDGADAASIQAAEWAKEAGVCVLFDGDACHGPVDALLPHVDVPVVSVEFVEDWMPGAPPEAALEALWRAGARIAVVTLGEKGCLARWARGAFAFPSFPVKVVDTTGAGDAFHGAFACGLARSWPVEETVRFASAVAAMNCQHLGGRTGLPTMEAVADFLRRFGGRFAGTPVFPAGG